MMKYLFWKFGMLEEYVIEYRTLITGDEKIKEISFYYFRRCPQWLLQEYALRWISGRIQTAVANVVYIESINDIMYQRQFIY